MQGCCVAHPLRVPWKPDLVYIGGISQRDIASIREVIRQLQAGLPEVEILLATSTFGTTDPRDPVAWAQAPHSGTGAYGQALQALAAEQRCAHLDMTGPWAEYFRSSQRHPHMFYRNVVHANEFGEQILAKIMLAYPYREEVWRQTVATAKELAALAERHDAVVLREPFFGGFLCQREAGPPVRRRGGTAADPDPARSGPPSGIA